MTEIITSNADAIFFDPFLMRAKDTTSNERLLSMREAGYHIQRMAYVELISSNVEELEALREWVRDYQIGKEG